MQLTLPISDILPHVYREYLVGLKEALQSNIYLYGGWPLSYLLKKSYFGDLDIVIDLSFQEIEKRLNHLGIVFQRNAHNTIRVPLSDGNYADLNSLYDAEKRNSPVEFLDTTTFTVNGFAVEIPSGKCFRCSLFEKDFSRKEFGLNPGNDLAKQRPLSVIRNGDILTNYYGLSFNSLTDLRWKAVKSLQNSWPTSVEFQQTDLLLAIKSAIHQYLPKNNNKYLTRGVVRCALLNEFTVWDDVDIFIEADRNTLIQHCRDVGVEYMLNFFGDPKLLLPHGQTVDLIPVDSSAELLGRMKNFFHDCDQICWDWQTEKLFDPIKSKNKIMSRRLCIPQHFNETFFPNDLGYYALKCLYLIVRHNMTFDGECLEFINAPQVFTPHHIRRCMKMQRELSAIAPTSKIPATIEKLDREIPSSAISVFRRFL